MKCYKKDYPRPQFVREQWENLNGAWDFGFDDQNVGESEKCSFMKSENFYTWEWFQMYRYKLTDKSSIYYFHYIFQ